MMRKATCPLLGLRHTDGCACLQCALLVLLGMVPNGVALQRLVP